MEMRFPITLTIRCYACGKVFDAVISSEDTREYPCPACGKVEVFGLGALKQKVVAANQKMILKSQRGRRR